MKIKSLFLSIAVCVCVTNDISAQIGNFTVINNTPSNFFISLYADDGSCGSSYTFHCVGTGTTLLPAPYPGMGTYHFDHVIVFNASGCPNTKCVPTNRTEVGRGSAPANCFPAPTSSSINRCGFSAFVPVVWNTTSNDEITIN